MNLTEYERHPLSAAMGDMEPDAFMALQSSISAVGFDESEPVILFEDMILDGWNRYLAARGLNIVCKVIHFEGTAAEAADLVWRKHGTRRNWDKSQRAMAQAKLSALRAAITGKTTTVKEDAAEIGVSPRTVEQARAVERLGVPELQTAVMEKDVTLKQADKIARLKPREQVKALATPPVVPARNPIRSIEGRPQIGATKEAHDNLKEALATIHEENEELRNRLAVHFMEGTDEEKQAHAERLAELSKENSVLRAELNALKGVSAEIRQENNELMKQCAMYRNQLQKRA